MSFFIKDLVQLKHFYSASCRWDIQTGTWVWHWNANGKFSCSSAYRTMHDRGYRCRYQKTLCKLKVPTKVCVCVFFFWLLLGDKVMTREVLQMRGWNVNQECVLCEGGSIETRDHMFWGCSYSTGFWFLDSIACAA